MRLVIAIVATALLESSYAAEPALTLDSLHDAARSATPAVISDAQLSTALANGLKHPEGTAVAMAIPRPDASLILVLVLGPDGIYKVVDVSPVETANFGVLGRKRREYERYETVPVRWLPRDDGLLQVSIQTQAWRGGQRYTVAEPLIIKTDGTALFR